MAGKITWKSAAIAYFNTHQHEDWCEVDYLAHICDTIGTVEFLQTKPSIWHGRFLETVAAVKEKHPQTSAEGIALKRLKGPLKPVVTEFCRKLKLQADVEAGGAEALLIGQSLATQGLKKFVRTHKASSTSPDKQVDKLACPPRKKVKANPPPVPQFCILNLNTINTEISASIRDPWICDGENISIHFQSLRKQLYERFKSDTELSPERDSVSLLALGGILLNRTGSIPDLYVPALGNVWPHIAKERQARPFKAVIPEHINQNIAEAIEKKEEGEPFFPSFPPGHKLSHEDVASSLAITSLLQDISADQPDNTNEYTFIMRYIGALVNPFFPSGSVEMTWDRGSIASKKRRQSSLNPASRGRRPDILWKANLTRSFTMSSKAENPILAVAEIKPTASRTLANSDLVRLCFHMKDAMDELVRTYDISNLEEWRIMGLHICGPTVRVLQMQLRERLYLVNEVACFFVPTSLPQFSLVSQAISAMIALKTEINRMANLLRTTKRLLPMQASRYSTFVCVTPDTPQAERVCEGLTTQGDDDDA